MPALFTKQQEFLIAQISYGSHQAGALGQLAEQDWRHAGRGRTHDDHIVGRVGGKALTTVAGEHLNIPVSQALEAFTRFFREPGIYFNGANRGAQMGENGRLVAAAPADFQSFVPGRNVRRFCVMAATM